MALSKCMLAAAALIATARGAGAFVAPNPTMQLERGTPSVLRGGSDEARAQFDAQALGAQSSIAVAVAGAAVLGSFVGAATRRRQREHSACNTICKFSKETELGAQAPLGFFDPLDLCKDEATFKDYRAKEIKHGCLAMMGALGMLTQSVVQLPGMEGVPKDVSACLVGNGQLGFLLTLAIIAGLEAAVFVQDETKEPGNFGNPLPWFDDYSPDMRARELNNGRIAMFAAIGQIAAGFYTGKSGIEQFS